MNKHLITFLFLLLAIALYFTGMALPATIFLVLGMVAEMVFWVRLFRTHDDNSAGGPNDQANPPH